jgi:hypothetical protein
VGSAWGGLGATRWRWRPDVRQEVQRLLRRHPLVSANTYVCHPWCGWGRVSVDFWGTGGRGDAIPLQAGWDVLYDVMHQPGPPAIRHTIYLHQLWTSFGGYTYWRKDDHSGGLRHVHVTFWK